MMLMALAWGAVAQEDCPLPTVTPTVEERQEWKDILDGYVEVWKLLGASGEDPSLTLKDIDERRIVVAVDYNLDDSAMAQLSQEPEWMRIMPLCHASYRLDDVFGVVANLGYDVVLHVTFNPGRQTQFFVYDNATLRRVMSCGGVIGAYIYADAAAARKRAPFVFDDSVMCTGVSYCNQLWTIHLHSMVKLDSDLEPRTEWMLYLSRLIAQREYLRYVGIDNGTARFVIVQDGINDTMVFEYVPAQLLGAEPTIDVDFVGRYLARIIDRSLPQPMPTGDGTFESCDYDPSLRVLVFNYLMSELSILSNEGKDAQAKPLMLKAMMDVPDGQGFFSSLVELELGLELRMQSRTTRRTTTFTYTTDELRIYMLEQQ